MSDGSGYSAAAISEKLRAADEESLEESPTYWWVPYIEDEQTLQLLLYQKSLWSEGEVRERVDLADGEELPDLYEETYTFRTVFKSAVGMTVREAIQEQNVSAQSAVAGFADSESDVSGTRALLTLVDRVVKSDAYIGYLFGDMGAGKTDFSVLLAELWRRQTGGAVGTNITSLEEADEVIETFGELAEWLDGPGEQLFVFDEASSHASGYAGDAGSVTSKMRGLLREFRKRSANLLIVGHTGLDVHPDIRRLATDAIEKESKKRAVVYDSVSDGEGVNEKFNLEGVPATEWTFETNEITTWSWEE